MCPWDNMLGYWSAACLNDFVHRRKTIHEPLQLFCNPAVRLLYLTERSATTGGAERTKKIFHFGSIRSLKKNFLGIKMTNEHFSLRLKCYHYRGGGMADLSPGAITFRKIELYASIQNFFYSECKWLYKRSDTIQFREAYKKYFDFDTPRSLKMRPLWPTGNENEQRTRLSENQESPLQRALDSLTPGVTFGKINPHVAVSRMPIL